MISLAVHLSFDFSQKWLLIIRQLSNYSLFLFVFLEFLLNS